MTYFLEDAVGTYLGDLASNMGLRDMREQKRLPRLAEFISEGQVTEGELPNLRAELQGDSEYGYVLELLDSGELPVIVTDGVGSTEDEEGEEEEEPAENYRSGQARDSKGRFGSGGGGGGGPISKKEAGELKDLMKKLKTATGDEKFDIEVQVAETSYQHAAQGFMVEELANDPDVGESYVGGLKEQINYDDDEHAASYMESPDELRKVSLASAKLLSSSDVDDMELVKELPGSTGPKLMKDKDGNKYVVKKPVSEDKKKALANEADVDDCYRAMGVDTPDSALVDKNTKVSRFIDDAPTLDDWRQGKSKAEVDAMHKKIGEGFVADSVLANWDVVGMESDNIRIKDGKPYRVDNGGGLAFRAQGEPKNTKYGTKFGKEVGELDTLRDGTNYTTGKVFGHLTDDDVSKQIGDVLGKKKAVLASIHDPKTRSIVSDRMDYLADHKKKLDAKSKPAPTTKSKKSQGAADMAETQLTSGAGLAGYLDNNKGQSNFTKMQIAKVEYLNPSGMSSGTVVVPKAMMSNPKTRKQLQQILPPGTKIKTVTPTVKLSPELKSKYSVKQKAFSVETTHFKKASPKSKSSKTYGSTLGGVTDHSKVTVTKWNNGKMVGGTKAEQTWADNLTHSEAQAVSAWKGHASGIRKSITSGHPSDEAKAMLSAIQKGAVYEGEVYRGVHGDYAFQLMAGFEKMGVGGEWFDDAPMGCSKNMKTGAGFSYGNLVLKVNKQKAARSIQKTDGIQATKDEQECVIPPNTKFRVLGIHKQATIKTKEKPTSTHLGTRHVDMVVELEEV